MADQTTTENEIKKAEQYEALKQTLLRLLDDPQVQQKIVSLFLHWFGKDLREKGCLRSVYLTAPPISIPLVNQFYLCYISALQK